MSIHDVIKHQCTTGKLYPLRPQVQSEPIRRSLFVGERLWEALNGPEGNVEWEERIGYLRADLENFVISSSITPKYLFLLYPPLEGIWEIRSVAERPSIRVLGQFADQDTFIATNFALREDLGGWESRKWKTVKREAKAVWRGLFDPYRPVQTTNVHDVVSGAINGSYFKNLG
jgi:hypothetical protein